MQEQGAAATARKKSQVKKGGGLLPMGDKDEEDHDTEVVFVQNVKSDYVFIPQRRRQKRSFKRSTADSPILGPDCEVGSKSMKQQFESIDQDETYVVYNRGRNDDLYYNFVGGKKQSRYMNTDEDSRTAYRSTSPKLINI